MKIGDTNMDCTKIYVSKERKSIITRYTFKDSKGETITTLDQIGYSNDMEAIASFKTTFGFVPEIRNSQIVMAR